MVVQSMSTSTESSISILKKKWKTCGSKDNIKCKTYKCSEKIFNLDLCIYLKLPPPISLNLDKSNNTAYSLDLQDPQMSQTSIFSFKSCSLEQCAW